jgi:hypothetical protein
MLGRGRNELRAHKLPSLARLDPTYGTD